MNEMGNSSQKTFPWQLEIPVTHAQKINKSIMAITMFLNVVRYLIASAFITGNSSTIAINIIIIDI